MPGTYSSDAGQNPDGSSRGYAVDGDPLANMTYSIAYVIPPETYVNPSDAPMGGQQATVVPFQDPNTQSGAAPGFPGTYVTGSPGGGNNTEGKGVGLVDGNPSSIVGGTLDPTNDDFSDVGYSEEYAIPFTNNNDYADPNTGLVSGGSTTEGGAAPGYAGETVGQGQGGSIQEGTGYDEVYEIPYVASDYVVDMNTTNYNDAAGYLSLIHI